MARAGFLGEKGHVLSEAGPTTARMLRRLEAEALDVRAMVNQIRNDALTRIAATASLSVRYNSGSVDVGTQPRLNFIPGSNVTLTVQNNPSEREVKVTIAAATPPTGANPTASVGLAAVNGVATTFMRSDAAPALSVAIVPTWTGIHTFTPETVHNGGVDLGTSGRFDSNVADSAAASSFLFRPTVAQTSGNDRYIFRILDQNGDQKFTVFADGTIGIGETVTSGGFVTVNDTSSVPTTVSGGILFQPVCSGAGSTIESVANTYYGGQFQGRSASTATTQMNVGGYFIGKPRASATTTGSWGGWFTGHDSSLGDLSNATEAGGWKVFGVNSTSKNIGTITNWYGGYVQNSNSGAFSATGAGLTNGYGIRLEEQTRAATINNGIFLDNGTAGYKAICIRDQNAWIGSDAAARIDIGATNFLVQSTSIGFFNVTPAARPSAYTQTYSTATKTHSNLTSATLTDSTGGTANTTLVDVGIVFNQAAINDNFADVAAQINALIVDITNVKGVLNSVIDDDQILGLKQ